MINLIAALDSQLGLADDNGIPWELPADKKYFRENTENGIVVMGYQTYLEFKKPLANRLNYVLVRDGSTMRDGFIAINNLDDFLEKNKKNTVWIIGGAKMFAKLIDEANYLYLTRLQSDFHCTKFFPLFDKNYHLVSRSNLLLENDISFYFEVWENNNT